MEVPDLGRIVETDVPVSDGEVLQLRRDVLPHIRRLQADGHLHWFCFLLHSASQVAGRDRADSSLVIHLRLEPSPGLALDDFIRLLPVHFRDPQRGDTLAISGVDVAMLRDDDWAHGWRLAGEASEWVLCLLETHKDELSAGQIAQFMHFITNPLTLGHRCLCIPAGFVSF